MGEVEFIRSTKTEGELTPECMEPIVIDKDMTLLKLQGNFGGKQDGYHRPFRFIAGSLLSFVNYDSAGQCYHRQGYWLEELGEGQFKKTVVLTGASEVVGFISDNNNVSMININTGSAIELGDYVFSGDYPETGSNSISRGVNLQACNDIATKPAQLAGLWFSETLNDFLSYHWDGDKLIYTKYTSYIDCYKAEKSTFISDDFEIRVLSGALAMKDGSLYYYNRILERDLPEICDAPDLTLTLDDIAGLWELPLQSGKEFYYDITPQGSKTLYANSEPQACLRRSYPRTLTRQDNGKFTETLEGSANVDIISFSKPNDQKLNIFVDRYNHLSMVPSESTLTELNNKVCD